MIQKKIQIKHEEDSIKPSEIYLEQEENYQSNINLVTCPICLSQLLETEMEDHLLNCHNKSATPKKETEKEDYLLNNIQNDKRVSKEKNNTTEENYSENTENDSVNV